MNELVYRGTQHPTQAGVRGARSFTDLLPVAVIWSARPGDVWANRKPQFIPTSTVHVAQLNFKNPLVLGQYNNISLGDVLRLLNFEEPDGITEEEVHKVYNYLHNRIIGKAPGGEFKYAVLDEGKEDLIDEDEVPFSLSHPQSLVSMARDNWDYSPDLDTADRVLADTFIFADSPTVQKVAVRLGYDAFVYKDVFAGGKDATNELLGMDVASVPGIEMEYDLHTNNDRSRRVPVHRTFRPLTAEAVIDIATLPTVEVIQKGLII